MSGLDYADGGWVAGVGAKASLPVARVTRKRPDGRRGDEIRRCDHRHATASEARRCAEAWAERLNGCLHVRLLRNFDRADGVYECAGCSTVFTVEVDA